MTPRVIFKTKKWVSILITCFGLFLLFEGIFPSQVQRGLEQIPTNQLPIDKPIPPLEEDVIMVD